MAPSQPGRKLRLPQSRQENGHHSKLAPVRELQTRNARDGQDKYANVDGETESCDGDADVEFFGVSSVLQAFCPCLAGSRRRAVELYDGEGEVPRGCDGHSSVGAVSKPSERLEDLEVEEEEGELGEIPDWSRRGIDKISCLYEVKKASKEKELEKVSKLAIR